jgi:hypothetical protein
MSDFKSKGGALSGREERYDGFEGEPKNIGGVLGAGHTAGSHSHGEHSHHTGTTGSGLTGSTGHSDRTGLTGSSHNNTTGSGLTGSTGHSDRTGLTGSSHNNTTGSGLTGSDRTGLTGSSHNNTTSGRGIDGDIPGEGYRSGHTDNTHSSHTGTTGSHNTTTGQKPSMLQKLNPFTDADHDGKKGINE